MKIAGWLAVHALGISALAAVAAAQEFRPQFKITLGDPHVHGLGSSVALDGDTLVVGAPFEDAYGRDSGAAYVYRRNAGLWELDARLVPPDPRSDDKFGTRLALSADTLLVSAPAHLTGNQPGTVYVYVRSGTTWGLQTRWDALSTGGFAMRGLALDGDLALIGRIDVFSGQNGEVLVRSRSGSTWSQSTVVSSTPAPTISFGSSIALDGNVAAIGEVVRDEAQDRNTGIVHLYEVAGGTLVETGTLVATQFDDGFGTEGLALSGDTLAIGAPYHDLYPFTDAGVVHVYVRSGTTWVPQALLVASQASPRDFGRNVALDGDTLLATVEHDTTANGVNSGSGRVFERSGGAWSEVATLISMEPRESLQLGRCAALTSTTAVLSSPRSDIPGATSGSVYVYARGGPLPALAIDALAPDPIESLYPGTDRTVSVRGTRLDLASALYVDGLRVDPARYALVAPDEIRLDMPQLSNVGPYCLGLWDGSAMAFRPFEVVAAATPRLEIGTGEPVQPLVHWNDWSVPVEVRIAGPVGSVHYVYGSFSNLPSSNRFVSFGLGNQFTDLVLLGRFVVPATGCRELQLASWQFPDPGSGSLSVYAQMFQLAGPAPFPTSNLESILVVP